VLNEGDDVSAAATTATKPNLFCYADREPVTAAALRTCPDQFTAGALQAETAGPLLFTVWAIKAATLRVR
jgi:hypothetical protein